jgi:hypothetical protein
MHLGIEFFKNQINYNIIRSKYDTNESYLKKLYKVFDECTTPKEFLEYPIDIQNWVMDNNTNFKNKVIATIFPITDETKEYVVNRKSRVSSSRRVMELVISNPSITYPETACILHSEGIKHTKKSVRVFLQQYKGILDVYSSRSTIDYDGKIVSTYKYIYKLVIENPNKHYLWFFDELKRNGHKCSYKSIVKILYNTKHFINALKEMR